MIHNSILLVVKSGLELALITNPTIVDPTDPAIAGVVKLGDLQGDPDPDVARISITLHENDPDGFISGMPTGLSEKWSDEVDEVEIGGVTTWKRRFTIKARCLLDASRESLADAREIASTVRTRIEHALPKMSFSGISVDGEYVSRPIMTDAIKGEMLQSGGPPDSYDYFIKVRFEVLTTNV
jgi:hypothetical protein